MTKYPTGRYEGRDVVIDFDTKEVKVRRITGCLLWRREEWLDVPLESIHLNTWWSRSLGVGAERFSVKDLSLTVEEISRGLGVMRLDTRDAVRIWEDQHSVKGDNIALDFSSRELVIFHSTGPATGPTMVTPFSAIEGVIDSEPPQIIMRDATFGREVGMKGLSMTAATLADRLGVVLIKSNKAGY
jgi:hypothetical protein